MVAQIDRSMLRKRPGKILARIYSWALVEGRPLTTKGRWINPVVFGSFVLATKLPAKKEAYEPIYIIGTGRSGTTILGKLFAMHKDAAFLNEPKAVWHYAHGAEDIAGNYMQGAATIRLPQSDASPKLAKKIAQIYSMVLRLGAAKRVVDKYPELLFRLPFVRSLFPKAVFIALQRDGVHTCSSIDRWSKLEGRESAEGEEDWWGLDSRKWHLMIDQLVPEHPDLFEIHAKLRSVTDDRDRAAVEWILSSRELRKVDGADDVIVVKYEDLCADPEATLHMVLKRVALEDDEKFFEYARHILEEANTHGRLALMPELVKPFQAELAASGYHSSVGSVSARDT